MKKNRPFAAYLVGMLFIFFSFIAIPSQVFSQNRSSVTGYVFDPQRRPVAQIPVELINEVNSVIQRTRTDGSGRFFFGGLGAGRFSIRVLPLGTDYNEQTQEVELGSIGVLGRAISDHVQKDFYLRPRATNRANEVTGTIFAQDVPEPAQKAYQRAVSAFDYKNPAMGIAELKKALELFPIYYQALERLGLAYIEQQKYEDARATFVKAVEVNPRSFNSWSGLSYSSYALQLSGAAVEAAQKAVSLNPKSAEAHLFLGISFRQDKQYEKAEKSLKQAEKLSNGEFPDVHWNLALLYAHNLKRFKDAAAELETYLKINPDAPNADQVKKLIKQFREKTPSN